MPINVQCLICKEVMNCETNDKQVLLQHVQKTHPYINQKPAAVDQEVRLYSNTEALIQTDLQEENKTEVENQPVNTNVNLECEVLQDELQVTKKLKNYCVTKMEHERKAFYKVRCPRCKAKTIPIICTCKERISHNATYASVLFKCWAICFSPSFFPSPIREHIKCSRCGQFLGVYHHQKQVVDFKASSFEFAQDIKLLKSNNK